MGLACEALSPENVRLWQQKFVCFREAGREAAPLSSAAAGTARRCFPEQNTGEFLGDFPVGKKKENHWDLERKNRFPLVEVVWKTKCLPAPSQCSVSLAGLKHRNCHTGLDQGLMTVPSLRCFRGQHKMLLKLTLGSTVLITMFNYGEYFCCLHKSLLDFLHSCKHFVSSKFPRQGPCLANSCGAICATVLCTS